METPRPERPKQEQTIFVKDGFLKEIEAGTKTAEVRPEDSITVPNIGETLTFQSSSRKVNVVVSSVERYKNIQYLIETADLKTFGSGIDKSNALNIWKKLYPNNKGGNIVIINFKLQKENV